MTNIVHICGSTGSTNCPSIPNTVEDLSILAVDNEVGPSVNTILDDVTNTTLTDAAVGIYALGEGAVFGGTGQPGYSRFTTSPSAPNWSDGPFAPSLTSACKTGS